MEAHDIAACIIAVISVCGIVACALLQIRIPAELTAVASASSGFVIRGAVVGKAGA